MNMVRLCCVGLMALTSVQGSCQEEPNSISSDRYALVVKKAPALQEGLFTYTVCLQLPKGDRVSSVFGTDMHPFELSAPAGVFNSPFNAGWSASGINPNFFKLMPEIQDDSFATIGLRTGARISGLQGAEDPTMVQDPGAPWGRVLHGRGSPDFAREHPHGRGLFRPAHGSQWRPRQWRGAAHASHHIWWVFRGIEHSGVSRVRGVRSNQVANDVRRSRRIPRNVHRLSRISMPRQTRSTRGARLQR